MQLTIWHGFAAALAIVVIAALLAWGLGLYAFL
jgi:hypothetical protein